MNPVAKYTLGRLGLFVVVAALLLVLPLPIDPLLKVGVAMLVAFGLQFVVLRKWRAEMINQVDVSMADRRERKQRLRAALAGEESEPPAE
ncbi:MAG: DUF4229 domain-containing protein [Micromonosporaceae bacterium]|nr:DUF4229 domain-containing protein [Micromonosporaceae bacterium]